VASDPTYQATRLLLPSDKDVTIELRTQPVIVRGAVKDSESGQPIPSFVVVKNGVMMGRTPGTGGRYEIEWTNSTLPLHDSLWIGIEAEGYVTTELRAVPSPGDRDEVVMDFRLQKDLPIVGVIRAGDGAPLAGAEIGLNSMLNPPYRLQFRIDHGHLVPNTNQHTPMKTDATRPLHIRGVRRSAHDARCSSAWIRHQVEGAACVQGWGTNRRRPGALGTR